MRHPSIKTRLIFGCAALVAIVLLYSKIAMYREVERSLRHEMDDQLLHSATLLSKSAELEAGGIVYEWQEAQRSTPGLHIEGLFQFWDLKSGTTARSPDLGSADLKFMHGDLNTPVYGDILLADGRPARALGFMHLPFTNEYGRDEMERRGKIFLPADFPQVIVCASATAGLEQRLAATRANLMWTGIATLLAILLAVLLITAWTLQPLNKLAANLLRRSTEVGTPLPEIPPTLPRELVPVTSAFRATLERVEAARAHEKDFAFSAAHQLRTPVAGLHAILEQALSRPREVDNLRERIGRALDVTKEIRHTIEGLMQLARVKGGIDPIGHEPYDPMEIVRELVGPEDPAAGQTHPVKIHGRDDLGPVIGDARLFRILVSILIENALRHGLPGAHIIISMDRHDHNFLFDITNEVDAFDPSDAGRIFRPFQRGKNTSVNSPGAGLGLALAKEISQRIGAELEMSLSTGSGPNSRISFKLTVPSSDATSDSEGRTPERP